jgi:hypothetical protein
VKKEFLLDPLNGVGPVRLGMSRKAVLAAFGPPSASFYKTPNSRYPTDAWYGSDFQVFYEGEKPTVAFIELSNGANLEAVLFGLPVFTTSVPALISEIGRRAELDRADPELGYSYTFPNLELAFWRPDNDDEETPYFATVGLGRAGYYSA